MRSLCNGCCSHDHDIFVLPALQSVTVELLLDPKAQAPIMDPNGISVDFLSILQSVCCLQGGDACHAGTIQVQPGLSPQLHVCVHTHTAKHNLSVLGSW